MQSVRVASSIQSTKSVIRTVSLFSVVLFIVIEAASCRYAPHYKVDASSLSRVSCCNPCRKVELRNFSKLMRVAGASLT